jgi:hypothetical protein
MTHKNLYQIIVMNHSNFFFSFIFITDYYYIKLIYIQLYHFLSDSLLKNNDVTNDVDYPFNNFKLYSEN